jgi:hypothetical protein
MERIAQNIAFKYRHTTGRANRGQIFNHYRDMDESGLFPVNGSFNATDRAINRLYRFEALSGYYLEGLELCLYLDSEISQIVNSIL